MEDAKEKNLELSSENLDKVSGGYMNQKIVHSSQGDEIVRRDIVCDVCGKRSYSAEDPVIPFQGGHLCMNCIKKVEEKLGRKIL